MPMFRSQHALIPHACLSGRLSGSFRSGMFYQAVPAVCVVFMILSNMGCNKQAAVDTKSPKGILEAMVAAYQKAKTYEDNGEGQIDVTEVGEERKPRIFPFSVAFSRPNKIRMQAYGGVAVCDGKHFMAALEEITNQVVELEAPKKLSLPFLYRDPYIAKNMIGEAGGLPQLALLMDKDPLKLILDGKDKLELLDPESVEDRRCHRVRIIKPDGAVVFWIDAQNYILRRIDYPTDPLKQHLGVDPEKVEIALTVFFHGAKFDAPLKEVAFEFEIPTTAKKIKQFHGPQPPSLSKHLGEKIPDFSFITLEGEKVPRQSLEGKVVVLDFWASWCGPCLQNFPRIQKVYEKYKDNPKVAFFAVSVDVKDVQNKQLQDIVQELKFDPSVLRDLEQQAHDVFGVEGLPCMFILGPDGTVQDQEIGENPKIEIELTSRLEKLLAGEQIHPASRSRYESQLQEYEKAILEPPPEIVETAPSDGKSEVPTAQIARKSEPVSHKLTKLWENKEVKEPGNVLWIKEEGGEGKFLVNDGWQTVAEIGPDGKTATRHELKELPPEGVISFLRTTVDGKGERWFLGSGNSQQQLHLFNQNWEKTLSFPQGDHSGIADAQIADLDGDGELEMVVSYWDVTGVQGVSLTGERLWHDRTLENVFRVAITSPNAEKQRSILCTNGNGSLVPFNHKGERGKEIVVAGRLLRYLAAADLNGDGQSEMCGLTAEDISHEAVVGIAPDGSTDWTYSLPEGVSETPTIEPIAFGNLIAGEKQSQWIVAASDGSVHILSQDGILIDKFNTGEVLTGIAVGESKGKPILVLSSARGLSAWRIEAK